MRPSRLINAAFLLLVCLATTAAAGFDQPLTVRAVASHDPLVAGGLYRLAAVLEIKQPWHVNANPASQGLIPTTVTVELPDGWALDGTDYPAGDAVMPGWSTEPIRLYSGQVVIMIRVTPDETAATGPVTVTGTVRYQACDNEKCLAPTKVPVQWALAVAAPGSGTTRQHPEIFGSPAATPLPPGTVPAATPGEAAIGMKQDVDTIERTIEQRGWLIALGLVFVGGLALNLTPCVYPMIAITVSVFGGQGERRLGSALGHAAVYCLGIVVTYSALGLAAALTGGLFGALLQSPVVLVAIALLMVALALSMFGFYELRPPSFLVNKAAGMSHQAGYVGVFLLGATVGVIAAPCLAPILVALLAYVGQRADPWIGWWLFFTLALGLGAPYLVLGTFSGLLARLPKSGAWMVNVKRVFGVVLVGVAIWFLLPLVRSAAPYRSPIEWQSYRPDLAMNADRPVMIDFYADWCIPCLEMEKITFSDPRVVEKAKQFRMLKVDLTHDDAAVMHTAAEQYGILGIPTLAFLNPAGREYERLRLYGFVPPKILLEVMDHALAGSPATEPAAPDDPETPDIPPALLNPF